MPINTEVLEFRDNGIYLTKELNRNEYLDIKKFFTDFKALIKKLKRLKQPFFLVLLYILLFLFYS